MKKYFPGRWEQETVHYFDHGGTGREYVVAEKDKEIIGFCRINVKDSPMIGANVYWAPLFNGDLGGIGPLGIAHSFRKKGLGLAIVQAGIYFLKQYGVNRIVIDWATLVDFYSKLGFDIWKTYKRYSKQL